MRRMTCLVSEVAIQGPDFGRRIGAGAVVDFDEVLTGTFTIAEAVRGREDCFAPLADEAEAPARKNLKKPASPPDNAPAEAVKE